MQPCCARTQYVSIPYYALPGRIGRGARGSVLTVDEKASRSVLRVTTNAGRPEAEREQLPCNFGKSSDGANLSLGCVRVNDKQAVDSRSRRHLAVMAVTRAPARSEAVRRLGPLTDRLTGDADPAHPDRTDRSL